jgi:hypothetical protein
MKNILFLSALGLGLFWFLRKKGGATAPSGFEGEITIEPVSQSTHADQRGNVLR